MHRTIITVAALLATTLFSVILSAAEHTKEPLDQVKTDVDEKKAVLVDVRSQGEWDDGRVAGAIFLPITSLRDGVTPEELKPLPKDKVIYCYCAVGQRALAAANILEKEGYTVRALKPGYRDLVKHGFESEPKK